MYTYDHGEYVFRAHGDQLGATMLLIGCTWSIHFYLLWPVTRTWEWFPSSILFGACVCALVGAAVRDPGILPRQPASELLQCITTTVCILRHNLNQGCHRLVCSWVFMSFCVGLCHLQSRTGSISARHAKSSDHHAQSTVGTATIVLQCSITTVLGWVRVLGGGIMLSSFGSSRLHSLPRYIFAHTQFFIFIDADCIIHDVIPMAVPGEFWLA